MKHLQHMKWVAIAVLLGTVGVVLFTVRRREAAAPQQSDQTARAEANQVVERLPTLDGYPFQVRYSAQARQQAVLLADLARDAYQYFVTLFPSPPPEFTALFLAPDDWRRGYGMPSYDPIERRLRVATNDNDLWQLQGRIARFASPFSALPKLKRTYADANGDLQLRRFFDLLAVHELAHAFEDQGGTAFPTLWLSEIYANLALHAFVAKRRPSELANLTTLPDAQSQIVVFTAMMRATGHTNLDAFEQHYPVGTDKPMSGPNYGWYQVRFTVLAREIFEEGGEAALSRLWAFGQREAARRRSSPYDYFRRHRTLDWFERQPAEGLASRLTSEVSPRLGQAVSAWP
jgi:hypothetical protein